MMLCLSRKFYITIVLKRFSMEKFKKGYYPFIIELFIDVSKSYLDKEEIIAV